VFDSHCHLTDEAYAHDLDAVLERAAQAGITGVVSIASNADDAGAAFSLAQRYPSLWCTAGIHPHEATSAERDFARIRETVAWPRVVAVGETGLDYHYDNSPRDVQRRSFARHLELAGETGLPVVVHSRKADDDTIAAVRAAGDRVRGVMHCFSGGDTLLDTALELGWYVSFAGVITFKKFDGHAQMRRVPSDRLLLETDGPYLAPVPFRGKRNEPAYLAATCDAAARILERDTADVADTTAQNARRFYRL
jgi:TatD DNase family protein